MSHTPPIDCPACRASTMRRQPDGAWRCPRCGTELWAKGGEGERGGTTPTPTPTPLPAYHPPSVLRIALRVAVWLVLIVLATGASVIGLGWGIARFSHWVR